MNVNVKLFFSALNFLTVVPIPEKWRVEPDEFYKTLPYFPAVGLIIGLAAATLDAALGFIFPRQLVSAMTVTFLIAASGGLHLDGLADTADGFFSSRPRNKIFDIMKDSHIGAMGVIAIVGVILLKFAAIAALDGNGRFYAILLAPVAGRTATLFIIGSMNYARPEGGLGSVFAKERSLTPFLLAATFFTVLSVVTTGFRGMIVVVSTMAAIVLIAGYIRHKIGGFTGDTLGAACELTELVPVMVLSLFAATVS